MALPYSWFGLQPIQTTVQNYVETYTTNAPMTKRDPFYGTSPTTYYAYVVVVPSVRAARGSWYRIYWRRNSSNVFDFNTLQYFPKEMCSQNFISDSNKPNSELTLSSR